MSDLADIAQAQIETIAAAEIARRKPDGPPATGLCLHCGEPVPEGRRWCDIACRDDWAREQLIRSRHG
ncbi:MAG: hypothetical protein LBI68_01930 [Azoarcus sp.]|jgi:hypothetical protein|nr:hypothetical protein [Azoarcus sp.]